MGRLNDLWAYDVVNKEWIEFHLPGQSCKPRGRPGLAAVFGKIWLVNGISGVEPDDVRYFDLIEGWTQVDLRQVEKNRHLEACCQLLELGNISSYMVERLILVI